MHYGRADELAIGYGVGVFKSADKSLGEMKVFNLENKDNIWDGLYWDYQLGYIGQGAGDEGRKSMFFGSTGPGFEVNLAPVEIRSGWGLAAISNPDTQLGGMFPQFHGDFSIGLRDVKGDGIAIQYNHISSAGIVTPNQGKDFILLKLSFLFF